jgi:ribosomal protein RSM22 (predicted rRNA methylase)
VLPALPDRLFEVIDAIAGRGAREEGKLAAAVAALSAYYTRREEPRLPAEALIEARLRFFLPRDLPKVAGALEELALVGALPEGRVWRVLDVGAGLGATSLGVALFAAARGAAERLVVTAIDRDPRPLRVLERLAAHAGPAGLVPIELRTVVGDALGAPSAGEHDLVVAGFVLNELAASVGEKAELLARLAARLAPGGSLVVLEPALRTTSRELQAVRDRLVAAGGPPYVFAPCLTDRPCPMLEGERDWCHDERADPLPPRLARIARGAGLRESRPTWSYLTLRNDGRSLRELGSPDRLFRVVSAPLRSKGKLELHGCGVETSTRLVRLDRHRSPENAALDEARRGAVIELDGGGGEMGRIASTDRVELPRP